MRVVILESIEQISFHAANVVSEWLAACASKSQKAVLGLATGGTPLGLYRELIRRYSAGEISMSHVTTFNLDEYVGLSPDHPQSYHYYMHENLFRHVDINPTRTHIPQTHNVNLEQSGRVYESRIAEVGGIDLQILGIGTDGHIGFNEVGSSLGSRTRVKTLTRKTRQDNARYFGHIDEVPRMALTMGIGTILDCRRILLLAAGSGKATTIRNTIEGPITASVPASVLQLHPNVTVYVDREAASLLQHREYYEDSEQLRSSLVQSS